MISIKTRKNELAFVYRDESTNKIEDINESYNDSIISSFDTKKKLKIETFKVTKNGYKMGERFLKLSLILLN